LRAAATVVALLALAPAPARSWLASGHREVAEAAVRSLPSGVPAFLRDAPGEVARLAAVPDLGRGDATPALRDRESPEHYIDLERLAGRPWPELRSRYLAELAARGLGVGAAGTLPWAVREQTERLALALALHRRDPADGGARALALVSAGALAHYAADLEQPLHTTIHHDGWALPDGRPPFDGTHLKVDALIDRARFDHEGAAAGAGARNLADLDGAIRAELAASHALLDRTYALVPALATPAGYARPEVAAFACERYEAAVRFVASLLLTAWERSAAVELPSWSAAGAAAAVGRRAQAEKELPQPQLPVARGLWNLKPAPFMPKT